ncbi:GDSL-type esterase/lipase family protein [Curtobacterium flaccumfaciens]|nr:GDSL-type esterase/lipase family protein [Curtobacterium flaccumfaciens]
MEVLADERVPGIVVLGDSITDGAGANAGRRGSWPTALATRLLAGPGPGAATANAGISGNRLLNPGFGDAGLARFDRDVLATPGCTHVIVLAGINDIAFSISPASSSTDLAAMMPNDYDVQVDDLIAAYCQIIERCHDRSLTVIGATLTPFGESDLHTPRARTYAVKSTIGSATLPLSTKCSTSTRSGATSTTTDASDRPFNAATDYMAVTPDTLPSPRQSRPASFSIT